MCYLIDFGVVKLLCACVAGVARLVVRRRLRVVVGTVLVLAGFCAGAVDSTPQNCKERSHEYESHKGLRRSMYFAVFSASPCSNSDPEGLQTAKVVAFGPPTVDLKHFKLWDFHALCPTCGQNTKSKSPQKGWSSSAKSRPLKRSWKTPNSEALRSSPEPFPDYSPARKKRAMRTPDSSPEDLSHKTKEVLVGLQQQLSALVGVLAEGSSRKKDISLPIKSSVRRESESKRPGVSRRSSPERFSSPARPSSVVHDRNRKRPMSKSSPRSLTREEFASHGTQEFSPNRPRRLDKFSSPPRRRRRDSSSSPERRKGKRSYSPARRSQRDTNVSPHGRREQKVLLSPRRRISPSRRPHQDANASPSWTRQPHQDASASPSWPRRSHQDANASPSWRQEQDVLLSPSRRSSPHRRLIQDASASPSRRKEHIRSPSIEKLQDSHRKDDRSKEERKRLPSKDRLLLRKSLLLPHHFWKKYRMKEITKDAGVSDYKRLASLLLQVFGDSLRQFGSPFARIVIIQYENVEGFLIR
ncbi:serine/arginine repetitive matrix protein 1-like [Macrobrachium nipponense]|uniref:serine/arginine repetitive matrix protein 1-like n=1 Tax=Macrobrachium nipponense TaxID=159736 RepID=UPI0030C893A9